MNRLLTRLSAAVCVAAVAAPVLAGPTPEVVGPTLMVSGQGDTSPPSTSDLIRATFERGFGSDELDPTSRAMDFSVWPIPLADGPAKGTLADISDFISPTWNVADASVDAFSQPTSSSEASTFGTFSRIASPDAEVLSVPQIPLPLPLVPYAIGLAIVVVAHRRSLRHRSLLR